MRISHVHLSIFHLVLHPHDAERIRNLLHAILVFLLDQVLVFITVTVGRVITLASRERCLSRHWPCRVGSVRHE